MADADGVLGTLERRSSALLLAGGALAVVYALLFAAEAIQGIMRPGIPQGIASGPAYALAFVGLLGLYPAVVDEGRWLARIGAVCAALGAFGFGAVFAVDVAKLAGVVPTPEPAWLGLLNLPTIIGLIPGFLLFGVASLRSEAHPRPVGYFLLVPAVAFSANFVALLAVGGGELSPWVFFVVTLGEAFGILGAGYLLRHDARVADRAAPSTDGDSGVVTTDDG